MTPRRLFLLLLALFQLALASVLWGASAPIPEPEQRKRALLTTEAILDGLEAQGVEVKDLDPEAGAALVGAIFGPVREDIQELAPRDRRPARFMAILGAVFLVLAVFPARPFGHRRDADASFPTEP
ncbi:MAG: hypothetical protein RIE32_13730 [Phycisphaerales bacterium]